MGMRTLALKAVGVLTIAGLALLGVIVFGPHMFRESAALISASLISIALGSLLMIVHINLTKIISEDEKTTWRRWLWAGPLVAGAYLWVVGSRSREKSRRGRPNH